MDALSWFLVVFPLGLAAFMVAMWRLSARVQNFSCPQCGRPVSKSAITLRGVDCPQCDWSVRGQTP